MSAVEFRGVAKRYGKVEALAGLDLDIRSGEFVSLLGPSGSGKTTSLNLLAGLIPIDDGEIRIDGRVVNALPPDKRDIAMVFQNYALYPHMTVYENLAFPLRARGRRRPEQAIREKIEQVSKMLGVFELLARYPKELSGGQQQRVALGRAMVRDPKVFLLDEPLSNLDARLRIRMRHDIKALHDALASTIVYVTHDQAEAMTLSTRIAVFNLGRLQQYGTPDEIYNRPANMFVANFLGEREMNFLTGRITEDGAALAAGGLVVPLGDAARRRGVAPGRTVTLGVRAEGVQPGEEGLDAVVSQTELAGPDLILYARVGGDTELCCRADPAARVSKGATVRLRLLPERLHLFDPETTRAL